MAVQNLSDILFKSYRRRVMELLLLHPEKKYHVREIARLTSTVAGTLHRELSRLEEAGILSKEEAGNQVFYSANTSCSVNRELVSILKKTSGAASVLFQLLEPFSRDIDRAFIFGSYASDTETTGSDIDLMVIGNIQLSDIADSIYNAQEILSREINPKVFTPQEWDNLRKNKNAFVMDILAKPVIPILGGSDEP